MRTQIKVGKVILPLHGKATTAQLLLHNMAMQQMAGVNHLGHPRGFQQAPTSRKNPAFHRKGPTTRVEGLARAAMKEGSLK